MRQKIFKKYILAIGAIVMVFLTLIMVLVTLLYSSNEAKERYNELDRVCNSVSQFIVAATNDSRVTSPDRALYYVMSNIATVSDVDIFITDVSGVIKSCVCAEQLSTGRCDHIGMSVSKDQISHSENKNILSNIGIYETPHYVAVSEIINEGQKKGYIVAASSAVAMLSLIKKTGKIYLLSALVPISLMLMALYFLTYRFIRPLKLMSQAAIAMANGDFSKRIPVTSDDEIGELAAAFNQMTDSLTRLEETRKDFIANVSHELKTPMTTIGGFIDGIIDGTVEKDKERYYLELVSTEIKRLSRMVESMLNISRIESKEFSLKYENFDFKEMLLNVVIGQEQRIEENRIKIIGLDEIPTVYINADKDLIHRAVYNLVDNAVKFTEPDGSIKFSIKLDTKNIGFCIKNTGKGIRKEDLPYVFEKFYKGDKSRSLAKNSTGLGLYLVKTIIKNHGGSITVSSVENKFTAFEFTIPRK